MYKFKALRNILFIFFVAISVSTQAKQRFFSINIKAKKDGTLKETFLDSTQIPRWAINKPNFMKRVLKFNPKLRKIDKIKKGQRIYLELPFKEAMLYARLGREPEPTLTEFNSKWSVSYSLSRKNIIDSSPSLTINSEQNALYTIGVSYNHKFSDRYSYFATGYASKMNSALVPSVTEGEEAEEVEVPVEFAMKNYFQRYYESKNFILYGGADIERFSTFKVTDDNQVARLQHHFAFLTIGVAKPFSLFTQKMLFKVSVAQSVWNKLSLQSASTQTFESFSGNKVAMLFISSLTKRIGIHFYYDWHMLSAQSDLDIRRFGAGVHFRF